MAHRTPAELTGTLLAGRYRVGPPLARGGMGSVYEGKDERIGRAVAIKVLLPELSKEEVYVERFRREATASAALAHPNIAMTTDYGIDPGGVCFLVMERIDGPPLSTILANEGRLGVARTIALGQQVCSALEAAHAAGIVHRDLKPGNVLVVALGDGRELVKIVDFGIAQLKQSKAYARLTSTGALLGTPAFMAPEQARGETVDGRADVYALGVILYGCLTGKKAFDGPDAATIVQRILEGTHVPLQALRPDAPPALAAAIETALARDKNARFATARAFADALGAADAAGQARPSLPPRSSVPPLSARPIAPQRARPIAETAPPPAVAGRPAGREVRRPTRSPLLVWGAIAVVAVLLAAVAAVVVVVGLHERAVAAAPAAPVAVVVPSPLPPVVSGDAFKTEPSVAASALDAGAAAPLVPTPAPPTVHHHHHADGGAATNGSGTWESTGWVENANAR